MTTQSLPGESAVASPYDDVLAEVHRLAREYLATITERPVSRAVEPGALASALGVTLPETGIPARDAVAEWFIKAEPAIFASSGPRFFGFVTGGATPAALGGDWLASTLDQNAGFWLSSPAAAETETVALDWLKQLFGIPAEFAGSITTGATMANVVGLASARQWASHRLGFDAARDGLGGQLRIPVVSTTEIHASARKALGILGLGRGTVIEATAPGGSADPDALRNALQAIEGPVILVANAAEVNTGAFDPIELFADLRDRHPGDAWLHIDGAFGLFAALSPRFRPLLTGYERADSIAADAHKWLNVPYDGGFAFVRDQTALRESFTVTAGYLTPGPGAPWDPQSHTPEMSRRFRALTIWCALRAAGRDWYREMVERCVDNAADFAAWVEDTEGLELLAPAHLNIVCFRLSHPGLSEEQRNELTKEAVRRLQADGRAFVTGAVWQGKSAIRAAFDNWQTTRDDVLLLQAAVSDISRELRA